MGEHQTQHQTDWGRYGLMVQSFPTDQFTDQIYTHGPWFELSVELLMVEVAFALLWDR